MTPPYDILKYDKYHSVRFAEIKIISKMLDLLEISFQVLAALAVSFGPMAVGLGKGYTAPALASLQKDSKGGVLPGHSSSATYFAPVRISEQEGSWVASLSLLGALFGGLVSGFLIRHGRRRTLIWTSLPLSASWVATVFANSVDVIYATAFIAGFCSSIIQLAVSQTQTLFNIIN